MQENQFNRIQKYSRSQAALKAVLEEMRDQLKEQPRRLRKLALVVDDDPMTKMWVRRLLEKENFAVMTASSAADCFKTLERVLPDLVVLDLMIPDGNGDHIFEQLRQSPRTVAVPVIFMSGTISMHEEETLNTDAKPLEAYLSKPFEPARLIELARKLMRD